MYMESTTLFIIRHGQTDWNIVGKIQGQIDIPLNDTGKEQAQRVASFLKKKNVSFSALYSSDLQRAYQTAQPISKAFSLTTTLTPFLREQHVGIWQGRTRQEMREQHGGHFDWERVPDGETKTEFLRRIVNHITLIAQNHINESVIIVTHAGAIKNFLVYGGYTINELPNTALITVKYHHTGEQQIELISIEGAE